MATPIPKNQARVTSGDAARATGGTLVRGADARVHVGVVSDARAVLAGSVFVALRGARFDGHDFVGDAERSGASLVVVERGRAPREGKADVVEVDDTLVAWGELARAHLAAWRAKDARRRVVAITGTAGKTTTKELCAACLGVAGDVHATVGNLNNRVGVPATIFALEERHMFAVLETGMSVPGEIAALGAIALPDVAIVTNVGIAHAEGVGGTRDAVGREKGALYAALRPSGTAVVNVDDDVAVRESARAPQGVRRLGFGKGESADYRLVAREGRGEHGSRVTLRRKGGGTIDVDLPLVGEPAAIDLAAALAAAEAAAGTTLDAGAIGRALSARVLPEGRASLLRLPSGTLVLDDSYNANPDSMRAALETLREIARSEGRRAVAVLGEMRELGQEAERAHDALGGEIRRTQVSLVIGCGGLVDRALDVASAEGAGCIVKKAKSTEEAAVLASALVRRGDVVLVKGSRGVMTEKVIAALKEPRP